MLRLARASRVNNMLIRIQRSAIPEIENLRDLTRFKIQYKYINKA